MMMSPKTVGPLIFLLLLTACGGGNNDVVTDPGTTIPGTTDPGTTSPGTNEPVIDITINDSGASLSTITLTAPFSRVRVGESLKFTAIGTYSDGSSSDISNNLSWSTSVFSSYASIDSTGLLQGLQTGIASVIARPPGTTSTIVGSSNVYIDPALVSLVVTTDTLSTVTGQLIPFQATGIDTNGTNIDMTSTVSWSSSNTSTVSINPSSGQASTLLNGSVTITASHTAVNLTASHNLIVADDAFNLMINAGSVTTHVELADTNSTTGFDPLITTYYDHTTTNNTQTNILEKTSLSLQHSFDISSSDYLHKLTLEFDGNVNGSFVLNTNAQAEYITNGITYTMDDGIYSSGNINISLYDAVTGRVTGTYNLNLCIASADCSLSANQINLQGEFDVKRESDHLFYAEGTNAIPVNIGTAPVDYSGIVDKSSSYYNLNVIADTLYTVKFYNQTDGNMVFKVYDDADYTNLLCDLATITQDAKICQIQTTGNKFYIQARATGLYYSEGARYQVSIAPAPLGEGTYDLPLDLTAALPSNHSGQVAGYGWSYYKFTVSPGSTYTIKASNLTERIRMDVTIMGSYNFTEDCSQQFSDNRDLACSVTIPAGNTEALLEIYSPAKYGAFYSLAVESGGLTSEGIDASPINLGALPVTQAGQVDSNSSFYTVAVSAGNPYTVSLTYLTDNAELVVYWQGESGDFSYLPFSNPCFSQNTGTTAESCTVTPTANFITVRVNGHNTGVTTTGNGSTYTINIQ